MPSKNTDRKSMIHIWICILLFTLFSSLPFLVPHCGLFSLFAFVPLLFLEKICRERSIKHTWLYYYIAFFLFNVATTFWIWWISPVGAVAAIALNALQMAFVFYLFRWSRRHFNALLSYSLLIAAWLAWEHVYQIIEISWPWLVLGNSFATSVKLVQWYEFTGSLGGSLWILLTNVILFETIIDIQREMFVTAKKERRRRRTLIISAIVIVLVPIYFSLIMFSYYRESDNPIEVVAVQPNIDSYTEKHGGLSQPVQDERLIALADTKITPNTRYLITPETFTYNLYLDRPLDNCTVRTLNDYLTFHPDLKVIFGSLTVKIYRTKAYASHSARSIGNQWYDMFNSAILIDRQGAFEYYHKSKLVPGVEIIPYQRFIPFLGKITSAFGGSMDSYGRQDEISILHDSDGTGIGAMICYESIYGDYFRKTADLGAQFACVITNDGWWGNTPGYRQHFRFAGLRAIETRRDVVHVANTGITGFIDQRGMVKQRTGWWEPVAIRDTVNLNSEKTFYTKYGDVTGRIACIVFLLLMAAMVVRKIVRK